VRRRGLTRCSSSIRNPNRAARNTCQALQVSGRGKAPAQVFRTVANGLRALNEQCQDHHGSTGLNQRTLARVLQNARSHGLAQMLQFLRAEVSFDERSMRANNQEGQQNISPANSGDLSNFFRSTPFFFILLGIAFLISAGILLGRLHPSFVFLIAILGFAIVLYGTGTQGIGSAEFKDVPVKVVIFGGAGVLALLSGYGIVWKQDEIKGIFEPARQYGLAIARSPGRIPLTTFQIAAELKDGEKLHILVTDHQVQALVPVSHSTPISHICWIIRQNGQLRSDPNNCPELKWHEDTERTYGDKLSRIAEEQLPLNEAPATPYDAQTGKFEDVDFKAQ
jgi:hypothetical protein